MTEIDYRAAILALLEQRQKGRTICPSEVLNAADKGDTKIMEQVRRSAIQLEAEGLIEITQKGRKINPRHIKGPIRLRRPE